MVLFRANLFKNWEEIKFTCPKQEFSEETLELCIFRFLISDAITNGVIITIDKDTLAGPAGAPLSNTQDYHYKLFYVYGY